jgi:uncharacterized protein YbgA (DUF1722 family)
MHLFQLLAPKGHPKEEEKLSQQQHLGIDIMASYLKGPLPMCVALTFVKIYRIKFRMDTIEQVEIM